MTRTRALAWLAIPLLALSSCGDDPASLNSQGYRALRFDADIDAQVFFELAAERADHGPEAIPADDPERRRTEIGLLAVGAWFQPSDTLTDIAARLAEDPEAFEAEELDLIGSEFADAWRFASAAIVLNHLDQRGVQDSKLGRRRDELARRLGHHACQALALLRLGL